MSCPVWALDSISVFVFVYVLQMSVAQGKGERVSTLSAEAWHELLLASGPEVSHEANISQTEKRQPSNFQNRLYNIREVFVS